LLRTSDLRAGYGESVVLQGVSFTAEERKVTVITGPNGHGKSTLLRVLSGLVPARAGEAVFQDQPLAGKTPAAIVDMGLVHIPQGDLIFQDLTVEQNLLMGAFARKAWKRRRQRLQEVFTLFPRLEERRRQHSRTLSGGERRMLAIGRGLMSNAQLLMVDEPALGLAPGLVKEVYATLARIAREEATILLVEESVSNAGDIADYVYLMENGRVAHEGTIEGLVSDGALKSVYLGKGEVN
jgi:branched-chain amino acid transport system ATP-binding protein